MGSNRNVAWAALWITSLAALAACEGDASLAASAADSEAGEEEVYGAVDPDEKPVTSGKDWDVSKIENELSASMMAQVFLKNGIKIEPFAFGVKLVGMTESAENAPPVLLFSGKECSDCQAARSLYIHSVPDKATTRLEYPTDSAGKRVRFYYGSCLTDGERHLVHHTGKKTTIFTIANDGTVQKPAEKGTFSEESEVLARVKRGTCQELKHEATQ